MGRKAPASAFSMADFPELFLPHKQAYGSSAKSKERIPIAGSNSAHGTATIGMRILVRSRAIIWYFPMLSKRVQMDRHTTQPLRPYSEVLSPSDARLSAVSDARERKSVSTVAEEPQPASSTGVHRAAGLIRAALASLPRVPTRGRQVMARCRAYPRPGCSLHQSKVPSPRGGRPSSAPAVRKCRNGSTPAAATSAAAAR